MSYFYLSLSLSLSCLLLPLHLARLGRRCLTCWRRCCQRSELPKCRHISTYILGALVCMNIHGNTWTHALHATRFNCLTLPLYHLEVGWSFYPFLLFLWPIACVLLEDVFHYSSILSCIPIDCSLTNVSSCWPGLGSLLRCDVTPCLNFVVIHSD